MLPDHCFVIDFETTGVDAKTAHPLELAIVPYDGKFISTFIKPPVAIPPETSAVHHITDEDVLNAAPWEKVKSLFQEMMESCEITPILVAHNAQYEKDVLGEFTQVQWLCTYKSALRVWPDAPGHKNEVLRYWLKLPELGRGYSQNAHSALHDCIVTQQILLRLLDHASFEQMIEWTKEPAMLPRIPFGKHFGQPWSAVPTDYLQWILRQPDMREDVLFCSNKELTRRRTAIK